METVETPNAERKESIKKKKKFKYGSFIWFSILIVIITIIYALAINHFNSCNNWDYSGTFGDSFGGLTAVFTGLAFAGVIYTIILQRKELKAQRKEFHTQNDTLTHQRFENTFFQLLKVHTDNVSSIDLVGTNSTKGRDCFKLFYTAPKHFNGIIYKTKQDIYIKLNPNEFIITPSEEATKIKLSNPDIENSYLKFYKLNQADLSHYFKTIYQILKFVDQASHFVSKTGEDNLKQKKFYTGILRAQLSTYEVLFLLYNTYAPHSEKARPLIKKFDMLKGIEKSLLIDGEKEYEHLIQRLDYHINLES